MKEVNKETLDNTVLEKSLNEIYSLLIKQGYSGDSTQVKNYFNFKQEMIAYKKLDELQTLNQAVLDTLNDSRLKAAETDIKIDAEDADALGAWKGKWHDLANQLRTIIRDCPLPKNSLIMLQDESGNPTYLNEENTLTPLNREKYIDAISSMERTYLEDLNKLEKSRNLLSSKYKEMALFSLCAAFFLDFFGTAIGFFLYHNKPSEKTKDASADDNK